MKIYSPMPSGSGAYVVHKQLEKYIPEYTVCTYDPYLTVFPPSLFVLSNKIKANLIHTTPDYGIFFKKKNIPLVITFHGFVLDRFMRNCSTLVQYVHYQTDLRWLTIMSLRFASIVTAVSNFVADTVKNELNFTGTIRTIYNGIDTNLFVPAKEIGSSVIKVVFVGNQRKAKGIDLLPRIAERLNNGIVIQYTSGLRGSRQHFDSSNIINIGSFKHDDMPLVYQQADILVFPTFREGFGLAAAEAMACGLPVVATNCSSLPELVVNGKGGYLCEVGDVAKFAERINTLAESSRLRREMGEYNRCRIEQYFNIDNMIRSYCDLFEEILDCPGDGEDRGFSGLPGSGISFF